MYANGGRGTEDDIIDFKVGFGCSTFFMAFSRWPRGRCERQPTQLRSVKSETLPVVELCAHLPRTKELKRTKAELQSIQR